MMLAKISEYANTQNIVKKQFFIKSSFHITIKKLSQKIRTSEGQQWFYERMRENIKFKMKQKDLGKNKNQIFRNITSNIIY